MRILVIVLVLLAVAKIGTQQYLTSTAKNEIIVAAYKDRAVGACERAAKLKNVDVKSTWSQDGEVHLVIGKGNLDVHLWQVDHTLWQTRFKSPYLFLSMREEPQRIICEFDIVHGQATVLRM